MKVIYYNAPSFEHVENAGVGEAYHGGKVETQKIDSTFSVQGGGWYAVGVEFYKEGYKQADLGLHTHEFHSLVHPYASRQKVFEAYAQNKTPGAYRVFWCYGPGKNQITIFAITPHP